MKRRETGSTDEFDDFGYYLAPELILGPHSGENGMNDEGIIGIGKRPAEGTYIADGDHPSIDQLIEIADRVGSAALSKRGQMLSARLAEVANAPADVAALTIKLADAEERLAKLQPERPGGTPEQFSRMSLDPVAYLREVHESDVGYVSWPAYTSDAVSRVLERLANAEARVEKAERQARHDREHAGKVEARNRTQAETIGELQLELAGITHDKNQAEAAYDGCNIDRENLKRKLADMTTNRDALVEVCERKDKRIEEYGGMVDTAQAATDAALALPRKLEIERDTARDIAALFRETLVDVRGRVMQHDLAYTASVIDSVLATVPPERPRCRVVTSPRFYGEVERNAAINAVARHGARIDISGTWANVDEVVDLAARTLGMRRA